MLTVGPQHYALPFNQRFLEGLGTGEGLADGLKAVCDPGDQGCRHAAARGCPAEQAGSALSWRGNSPIAVNAAGDLYFSTPCR